MKKTKEKTEVVLTSVSLENVSIGDLIHIEEKIESDEYKILDKGNPFILIQNTGTGFAYLFEPKNNLYKKTIKKVC